jgi:dihydroorotate dehydrogenase
MFRYPDQDALINRMGFNNHGSAALATRLRDLRERGRWPDVPVGANIGKSKITPLDEAVDDYVTSLQRLAGLPDYFTVNVSSPNTPGLRDLQGEDALRELLGPVVDAANGTPVLLKLAPDLADEGIHTAVELAFQAGITGLVATNTTVRRDLLTHDPKQAGGLSGAPLWPFARERIQVTLEAAAGRLPVVGVGGIDDGTKAAELLDAGCVAVQLYSGMIFRGPGLIRRIHTDLARRTM